MYRLDVTIPTPDGSCAATLHRPDDGAAGRPAVIMYPDAGGARETFRLMADRMAGLGYPTLLPDVYYRHGGFRPFDVRTAFSDPDERERLFGMARSLTAPMVISDAGALLDFLADLPAARPGVAGPGVGTIGYCKGGGAALLVAGSHPDRVAAAASFHGGRLAATDDPDSPVRLAGRTRATVYVAAAANDPSCPAEQLERLAAAYRAAGVRHTIETYPAAHGFAVPDNPTYDATADERHWAAVTRLYAAALSPREGTT